MKRTPSIYNGTQHEIRIFSIDQCNQTDPRKLILKEGEIPVFVIPAGTNLNCKKSNKQLSGLKWEAPFPVKGAVTFDSCDELPLQESGAPYDIYVVSNLYRAAAIELGIDTVALATVDGVVYDSIDNPRPCGCLGLAIG